MPSRNHSIPPLEKPPVQCWRCKGYHSPGNCPHFVSAPFNQPSNQHRPNNAKRFSQPLKPSGPPHYPTTPSGNTVSIGVTPETCLISEGRSFIENTPCINLTTIPQQLVVPITIASWVGKAILDTGASYTLINKNLWTELVPQLILKPWNLGPFISCQW